jgi:hypothetical protein
VVCVQEAEILLNGQQAAVVFTHGTVRSILAMLRFKSPGGDCQVLSVMLPGPGEPIHERMDCITFTPAVVPYEPDIMGSRQGFFWWRWHNWVQNGQ